MWEEIGTTIAVRYMLVKLIGEGGIGSVYLASQTEPRDGADLTKTFRLSPISPRCTREAGKRPDAIALY